MPRNGSGTFTLVTGNPVAPATIIESAWANSTLGDIGNELTNSLSRTGAGGMLAPFRLADGNLATPGVAFLNETGTGLYRAGSGEMWAAVQGTQIQQYTVNGVLIATGKTFTAQGPVSYTDTLTGGTGVVNFGSGQFYKDASGNFGLGTSTVNTYRLRILDAGTQCVELTNSETDTTNKIGLVAVSRYTNADTPFTLIRGQSSASENSVSIGGGTTVAAPATQLLFYTNSTLSSVGAIGSERMRIDNSGNVSVGTASSLSRFTLEQNADGYDKGLTVSRAGADRGTVYLDASNNTLNFGRGVLAMLTVDSVGKIGIGTTSPSEKLEVAGTIYSTTGGFKFPDGTTQISAGAAPVLNIVTGTTQAATAGNHYVLTNVAATTVTLPASPVAGAIVWITVGNGLTTNVVARNGSNIQSLAEDMTLNAAYAAVQLRYINATIGWSFT